MKRTTDILILTAVLILTGCKGVSSLEPETGTSAPRPIEFGISSDFSVESKALISNANVKEYTFTAYGNLTVDGTQQTGLFGNNGTVVQWDATANSNAGAWSYSPARYWQPGSFTFAGVMPSIDGMTASLSATNALTLNFGTDGYNLATGQHDLMVDFQNATVQSPSFAQAVTFAFKHQLAQVVIEGASADPATEGIRVEEIIVYGNSAKTDGNMVFTYNGSSFSADYDVTGTTDANDPFMTAQRPDDTSNATEDSDWLLVAPSGTGKVYDVLVPGILVFPETCSFKILVTYTENGNTKRMTGTLPATWEAGKKYIYRFNLAADISFSVKVVEWGDPINVGDEITII